MHKAEETETYKVEYDSEGKVRIEPQQRASPQTDEAAESGVAPGMEGLKEQVVDAIRTVSDPEIPVNIYELGLVYKIDIDVEGNVRIEMTLTAPSCPVAGSMPAEVENRVRAVSGVADVHVELVWDPPWNQCMMSEAARLELGLD